MKTFPAVLFLAAVALVSAQDQPVAQPAAVVLPVVEAPAQPQQGAAIQQPAQQPAAPQPMPAPAPTPAPPQPSLPVGLTQPVEAAAPLLPPVAECPQLDQILKERYDAFFLLTRLVNTYTLQQQDQPTPAVNASYLPLTILAPTDIEPFLQQNNINIRDLGDSPLQSVLLAPTVAAHFVRGFFPASALPVTPVQTLCGDACGPLTFRPTDPVQAFLDNSPQAMPFPANTTITTPNAAECPGQWVIHEVDNLLYTTVTDPLQAAAPALDLSYALGGAWDSYPVVREQGGRR